MIQTQTIALFGLVTTAIAGLGWVFVYPYLSGEKQAERRMSSVSRSDPIARSGRGNVKSRREQVEESLREIDQRHKKMARPPLSVRIQQAGLSWSKRQYVMISAALGLAVFMIAFLGGAGLLVAFAGGFAGGFGLPNWILQFLKKRRETKFLNAFPDAVDVIVRGIKAGLPLLDSLKIITVDAPEPVRGEFKSLVETQTIGMPLGDACLKLYERMPLPEANFFGIVVSIQQKSGGNLSEALGNLSKVLRERKKMKAKIIAMSMEAKASAAIIGSLPLCVMFLVWLTSPSYIELLWTQSLGRMMLAASAFWMTCGVLVMRKMINFDF